MPRRMPALGSQFIAAAREAIALSTVAEGIRAEASYTNIKGELTLVRIEMLYEMSFLRLFASWEAFIEDSLIHMLCGFTSALYAPSFQPGVSRFKTFSDARVSVYRGRRYLLWYDAAEIQRRCARYLDNAPQETVAASNSARLDWFASIRHRIAHDSDDARTQFDVASINLAGRRFSRSRPGKLLRSDDVGAHVTFLESIGGEFERLALQIAP